MPDAGDPDQPAWPTDADARFTAAGPYDGFDLQVLVDRGVYAPGDTVRLTVTAANQGERFVEHHYPGWQRYVLTIRDEHNRVVADDEVERRATTDAIDRLLPGQMTIWPTYWNQTHGSIVPGREGQVPGAPVAPGRYRARVRWLGREPGARERPAEVDSVWFTIT